MPDIRLTPSGHLCWDSAADEAESGSLLSVREAFARDWRGGLFALAAQKVAVSDGLTLRYWQQLGQRYVTALCHVPGSATTIEIEPPSPAELATLVLTAPPMRGGEYLSSQVLANVWHELDGWSREAIAAAGGLEAFLAAQAPQWRQVGRVCFHLAENKREPDRPFAFLATYATGFGIGGRLKHLPLRQALEQYAGARNKPALIKLLTPVDEAAKACDWVRSLVDGGQVYQPLAWSPRQAYTFLQSVPALEDAGLSVRVPDWWKKRPRPRVAVTIGRNRPSTLGMDALLDFNACVALGDQRLTQAELEALLASDEGASGGGLVFLKGQWVEVDRARLQQAIEHWRQIEQQSADGQISFIEGMRLLAGTSANLKDDGEVEAQHTWAHVEAGEAMRQMLAQLREPGRLADPTSAVANHGVHATLRPYQHEGVRWLGLLSQLGLGACLADDMGLGKTLQVLAMLMHDRHNGDAGERRPALLIVPASLLGNWQQEAQRFTPTLKLRFLHPAMTSRDELDAIAQAPQARLAQFDLVVTTYAMLTRQTWLTPVNWRRIILDEAQAIKNPGAGQSKAVKKLSATARIALTGTPIENRLGDLWSIFDFLNPGLLGSAGVFKSFLKSLAQRQEDQYAPLRRLVGPYILRRLKTDRSIIADLPDKTETACYCSLTRAQVKLYEQTVRAMEAALDNVESDMARRGLVLQTLMRLKQICNHPSQLAGDGGYDPADSGKFQRLAEICDELAQRQEKVLIFTQFREIIDPLAEHLRQVFGRPGLTLHGGTSVKQRRQIVEHFQDEAGPPFFILSLKAGGTGLNLTAASHVIHFDRWWNPAVENQATDRAFRIGQQRNVLVHKFITNGTVEQRIDELIQEKRELAEQLLTGDGGEVKLTELPDEQILKLVRLDAAQAMM
ncbi:MAG: DEAD/DEAH box helicase [Phycisphaeraceae bacterium]